MSSTKRWQSSGWMSNPQIPLNGAT